MNFHNDGDLLKKVKRPEGKIRVVIDTDTYNEIDDVYALAYGLSVKNKIQVEAIYAAPFFNGRVDSIADGVEHSYEQIQKILPMLHREDLKNQVYRGCVGYLKDEKTPQESPAVKNLIQLAQETPDGEILYVACLAAITDVASALLAEPSIAKKIVVVWLGGHAYHFKDNREFNLIQDVAAARVVFGSGVPMVQIPCWGVTSHLLTTEPELRQCLNGKSQIGTYLYDITCTIAKEQEGKCWSRSIWDLSVMMWLAGPERCMTQHLIRSPVVSYEGTYGEDHTRHMIMVVDWIDRDQVFADFFKVLENLDREDA